MTTLPLLETQGCGCDRRDTVRALVSLDDALALITARVTAVAGTERLTLPQAKGRVLAASVLTTSQTPPFDNAAMDGYGIATASLEGEAPWTLDVVARIPAGQAARRALSGRQAARLFTGAPIPDGVDAVVMQEDVQRIGATVRLDHRPLPGLNLRRAGSEMPAGAMVLDAGQRLGTREIAACAAAGAGTVHVRRSLRVALLVTGDEVRAAGDTRAAAEIWDVNTPMLVAALTRPGIDLVAVENGLDSRDGLFLQLAEMAATADLVITTGGISVGEEDHVKPTLAAMGGEIVFSGLAIKPGKPVSFGCVRGVAWLGLPGNPLSAFVTWQILGEALVRRLTGEAGVGTPRRHVVTASAIHRKPGRCELRPASCSGFDPQGREVASFDSETHSARVMGLPAASGLIFLPADTEFLPAGALVEFLPFC